jgi:hypothetical protein
MTGSRRAFGGTRRSFRLAYLAVALSAALLVGAAWHWVHPQGPRADARLAGASGVRHAAIPSGAWGHAANAKSGMLVTLGPAADRRRRYQLGMSQIRFDSAAIAVSSDRGRTFHVIQGQPMGRCGFHWQGFGLNAIVATRDCVPPWAVDAGGGHAREWLRLENLVPFARMVMVRYSPAAGLLRPAVGPGM